MVTTRLPLNGHDDMLRVEGAVCTHVMPPTKLLYSYALLRTSDLQVKSTFPDLETAIAMSSHAILPSTFRFWSFLTQYLKHMVCL